MSANLLTKESQVQLGSSFAPNFKIDFNEHRKAGFNLVEIKVKHDPGYYLLAMHFVFQNSN